MKSFAVFLIGAFAFLVLMMPSLLPDFIPVVGALDEATATAVLLACARYFGFDFSRFFGKKNVSDTRDIVDVEADKVRR